MIGFLALLALQAPAADPIAPPGVLRGTVTDQAGRPIQRALVQIVPGGHEVATDRTGLFEFTGRAPGLYVLSVRALGYTRRLINAETTSEAGWTGRIALSLVVQELPELEARVNAWKPAEYAGTSRYDGYFMRRRLGFGTFFDRDDLDRISAIHLTQVLQHAPGWRVAWNPPGSPTPTTLRITRCATDNPPDVAVYVNGIRQIISTSESSVGYGIVLGERPETERQRYNTERLQRFADVLDGINPRDLEMVELYHGVAQIPAEFDRDVCAVVAVWTRYSN